MSRYPGFSKTAGYVSVGALMVFAGGFLTGYRIRDGRDDRASSKTVVLRTQDWDDHHEVSEQIREALGPWALASSKQSRIREFASCLLSNNEGERRSKWMALIREMTPDDCLTIREMFKKMDRQGRTYPFEWEAFWKRWGEIDGTGALAYIEMQDQTQGWVSDIAGKTFFGWAAKDPMKSRDWLARNQDSPLFNSAFSGYISGLALDDVRAGTAYALSAVPPGNELLSFSMGVLVEGAAQQGGLRGVTEWFDQLPDDVEHFEHKRIAADHVMRHMMQAGPDRAMDWLSDKAGSPWRNDDKIGQVADWVANGDPAAAMNWLVTLPASPVSGSYPGMTRVMNKWMTTDPVAFEAWLKSPKTESVQAQAVAAYQNILGEVKQ